MIKVISCFWNVENYVRFCIESLKKQTVSTFKVFLVDDMSTDNSVNIIKELIKDDDRFELIVNTEKKFKLRNMDELLLDDSLFDDDDIVVELDTDDFLFNNQVFERVLKEYKNPKLQLTNGSFVYVNGEKGFSSKCNPRTIRNDVFKFSHLRTWKRKLWLQIPEEYLKDENNEYFKSAPDVAYSMSMLELAGDVGYSYIPDILYVYNNQSIYNEHKPDSADGGIQSQSSNANKIRQMKSLYGKR